jgi:hypothetical protein
MCINLFGMLVGKPERATRLMRALIGEDVARVRSVAVEWAPEPAADFLADRTAFDAMAEYERHDGSLVLLGIETKLTDSFSQKLYYSLLLSRLRSSSPVSIAAEGADTDAIRKTVRIVMWLAAPKFHPLLGTATLSPLEWLNKQLAPDQIELRFLDLGPLLGKY